jgi:hypothetical protein
MTRKYKPPDDDLDPIVIVSRREHDFFRVFRDREKLQAAQQRARLKLSRQNNFTPTPDQPFLPD